MSDENPQVEPAHHAQWQQWATAMLNGATDITPLHGDASSRRYARLHRGDARWVLMDLSACPEVFTPFATVRARLAAAGLAVPAIIAADQQTGLVLLEDLGDTDLLQAYATEPVDALLRLAVDTLLTMQQRVAVAELPDYDADLLARELAIFDDWYLRRHLGVTLSSAQAAVWDNSCQLLIDNALAQPRGFVHRDFHARNLMRTADGLGLLDFQDALYGPLSYDLVSLLRDCYYRHDAGLVETMIARYYDTATSKLLSAEVSAQQFRHDFDLTGLQRHLKAIGIFSRLYHRDGKPGYLADIPRTLGYVREVCAAYPELAALRRLLDEVGVAAT